MNKYAGTQTEKNLKAAFAGESQARNSYTFFAEIAKKKAMSRLPRFLRRRRITSAHMRRCGARNWD